MAALGPILIIEDDLNDVEVIYEAFKAIGVKNELKPFASARNAYDYLMVTSDKPMIILCDIRMPGLDGLAFLKQIQNNQYLRSKAIPFIFYTGITSVEIVNEAYNIGIQGFYKKAPYFEAIKEQLFTIITYWRHSLHPVPMR